MIDEIKSELKKINEEIAVVENDLNGVEQEVYMIKMHKGTTEFYRESGGTYKYVSGADVKVIKSQLQASYAKRVLRILNNQKRALEYLLCHYGNEDDVAKLYEKMSIQRQKFVRAYETRDDVFARQWYESRKNTVGNSFHEDEKMFRTMNGEAVRSKSEVIIADRLKSAGVPYVYEKGLYLEDGTVYYPDFTVLNKRIRKTVIWEHFGMMNNVQYCEKAVLKIEKYALNGYCPNDNLIMTFETSENTLDLNLVDMIICKILK